MKEFLERLRQFIINLFTKKETNTEDTLKEEPVEKEEPIEVILKPTEEPKIVEVVDVPLEPEQLLEEPKEVYEMLSIKDRQERFKKIGLYTSGIDGIWGNGSKTATKIFNCVFLSKNDSTYFEDTDRLLRVVYDHYMKSPYINDEFMKLIKNFKKSELKCKCVEQGYHNCNGYPHELCIKLFIALQYVRFRTGKSVYINSGVRCVTHNKRVGGSSNSHHMYGRAADIHCAGFTAQQLKNIAYETPRSGLVSYSYNITSKDTHISVLV